MKELNYGPVRITKGKLKERCGYYDDDDDEGAIVYLSDPCLSSYIVIPHDNLEEIPFFITEKQIYSRN